MSSGITSDVATVDYLQLLTVQLQNQDPLDPTDQEGMISDLAQFSTLEGIEDLNDSFGQMLQYQELTQGIDVVGKEIEYIDGAGETKSGVVSEMFTSGGDIQLLVNGDGISLSGITGVKASAQ